MVDRSGRPQPEAHFTPRWVKVFGAIGIILVLLLVLMVLGVFGGEHGPRRHLGGGHAVQAPEDGRR